MVYGPPRRQHSPVPDATDQVAADVVDSAMAVHRELGPGLLESTYEACLARELEIRGRSVEQQLVLPVTYRGVTLEAAYRIDLMVDRRVLVEVKAVERVAPIHESQVLTYLKLSKVRLGLLINFHVPAMRFGLRRYVI